jgi:hypothetical protein
VPKKKTKEESESKDQRKGWLADLKEGDTVYFDVGRPGAYIGRAKIDKVTPGGKIRCGTTTFDAYGWEVGDRSWSRSMLLEPTQNTKDRYERQVLTSRLNRWFERGLNTSDLQSLRDIWVAITEAMEAEKREAEAEKKSEEAIGTEDKTDSLS